MTILFVDDHQIFREGVREFLKQESFCTRVDDTGSIIEAQERIATEEPDVLIADLSFPEGSGSDLLSWTRENHRGVKCLCMTMHSDADSAKKALVAGADGFITKSSGYGELVNAITSVASGRRYVDQPTLETLIDYLIEPRQDTLQHLSDREKAVFDLLVQDKTLDDIAETLFISRKTVENHRSSIYRKLGVHDRLSLFRVARSQQPSY